MTLVSRPSLLLLALILSCTIGASAEAQSKKDATLEVGSLPPNITSWGPIVSGKNPGKKFGNGTTYVVEFWATWCGPCRQSIPHLNQLYQTLKTRNVEMIGISDESEEIVKEYLRKKGPGMSYTVVADPSGTMNELWMKPAGAKGIPTAFIVGPTGRIAYIGHPMDPSFERVLFRCSEGRYDPTLMSKAQPLLDAADRSIKARDWRQAHRQLDEVIKLDTLVFSDKVEKKSRLMIESEGASQRQHRSSGRSSVPGLDEFTHRLSTGEEGRSGRLQGRAGQGQGLGTRQGRTSLIQRFRSCPVNTLFSRGKHQSASPVFSCPRRSRPAPCRKHAT